MSKPSKSKAWREKHPNYNKEWRAKHPNYHWPKEFAKYGLTVESYHALVEQQGNKCAICFTDKPGSNSKRWFIDHDHATGKVRGLLCQGCNLGLGHFRDNPLFLASAVEYLNDQTVR